MILQNLKTNYLGQDAIFYEIIDSTQKEICRRVQKQDIKNGQLILAQLQTDAIRNSWKKMAHR